METLNEARKLDDLKPTTAQPHWQLWSDNQCEEGMSF